MRILATGVTITALIAILTFAPRSARSEDVPPSPQHPQVMERRRPPLARAIRRQLHRGEYIGFETVIDSLDIRKGMTVLDIGAGPGYATFLFAEKLVGSGHVLATDIRGDFVAHIQEEAKRRGLPNVSAAVVKAEGLDDVYSRHRYDIVFLSNVYHCISDRVDYFSRLRAFLNDRARLVLIMYNQAPLFELDDLDKVEGLLKALSEESGDNSVGRYLSDRTRRLLEDADDQHALKEAIIADFNRMVLDPHFYKNFYRDSYFDKDLFSPAERDLANWLLMTLGESGALDQNPEDVAEKDRRAIIRLNRLFIAKRFGGYLAKGGFGAYRPGGDANRHTSKYVMFRELGQAGFRVSKEMKLSEYYDAIIMVPLSG